MGDSYVEYKSREQSGSAPKVTDPDAKQASQEQILRGLLELQGGGSGGTGSIRDVNIADQSHTRLTSSHRGFHYSNLPSTSGDSYVKPAHDEKGRYLVNLDTEIAGEDLTNNVLQIRPNLTDDGGNFGFVDRTSGSMKVDVARHTYGRSSAGEQSFGPPTASAQPIEPKASGSAVGSSCDILVKNTGTEILWVTGDGSTDSGYELKPDDDTNKFFYNHTSSNGDLSVRTDSGASSAGSAEALFRS